MCIIQIGELANRVSEETKVTIEYCFYDIRL